jgi:hypothetical protein
MAELKGSHICLSPAIKHDRHMAVILLEMPQAKSFHWGEGVYLIATGLFI